MQHREAPSAIREFVGWRHAATLLLLMVTVPVFLGAAVMAAVVVLPVALLIGSAAALQKITALTPAPRRVWLR
jgi:hypothetical protein